MVERWRIHALFVWPGPIYLAIGKEMWDAGVLAALWTKGDK